MWTARFWKRTAERAIQAGASAMLAVIGGNGVGITDVQWADAFSVTGLAMISSVLQSIVSSRTGSKDDPSLVD